MRISQRSNRRPSRDNRSPSVTIVRPGVTMIETLLVIMIATAALLAAPRVGAKFWQRTTVAKDTEEVLQVLRIARETALASACEVNVRHIRRKHPDDGQTRDAIELIANPGPYSDGANRFGTQPAAGSNWMVDPIWMTPEVELQTQPNTLTFRPDGTSSTDANWELSRDGESSNVQVQASTGNIILGSP